MNSGVDQNLLQLVQHEVQLLQDVVKRMSLEEEEKKKILGELQQCWTALDERLKALENNLADVTKRLECLESKVDHAQNRDCSIEDGVKSLDVASDLNGKC